MINYKLLTKLCEKINWNEISLITDDDDAPDNIGNKIKLLVEKSTYFSKQNTQLKKHWMTPALLVSSKKRQRLYKCHKKTPAGY